MSPIARFVSCLVVVSAFAGAAWAAPDLTPETHGRSDRLGGDTYFIGEQILIDFDVINNGDAPARGTNDAGTSGYMVDVIISRDNTAPVRFAVYSPTFVEDALLRGGRMSRTATVAAGARVQFRGPRLMLGTPPFPYDKYQLALPTGMTPGNYFVCVQVDPGARIAESNELNNTACHAIRLRLRPVLTHRP